jgi:hypothetical protein
MHNQIRDDQNFFLDEGSAEAIIIKDIIKEYGVQSESNSSSDNYPSSKASGMTQQQEGAF